MKQNNQNRIKLKFMDVSVELTGKKNLEQRAYSLMAALVSDRMRMAEIMAEMSHEEDAPGERKSKKKPIHADIEFLRMYA